MTYALVLIIGVIIGFLFANTPYAAKFGLVSTKDSAKDLALQVLGETRSETQSVLNDTVLRINQEVQRLESKVATLETTHTATMSSLQENIRQVMTVSENLNLQTGKLDSALRNNKQMGRWGELQLKRLVELSGMSKYVDFSEQTQTNEGRPDMSIKFANDTVVFVDAKVSLNAYLDGVAADDMAKRADFAKQQFGALKDHVNTLEKRNYHGDGASVPFTVMYVQVEGSLAFADEARTETESIVDYALKRSIIIATPGTLMALLRTANFSWSQRSEVANALDLLLAVKELGIRMNVFMRHLNDHAKALGKVHESYAAIVNSWNSRAVPQLTKINEFRADTIERPTDLQTHAIEQPVITQIDDGKV